MLSDETNKELLGLLPQADFVDVITMQAILHTASPTNEEMVNKGQFSDRLVSSFSDLLGHTKKRGTIALDRLMVCEDFETRQSFQGMGGCVALPLAEMLEEKGLLSASVVAETRKAKRKPNTGSMNDNLSTFAVGEKRYVETTLENYGQAMRRINTPKSRRPAALKGFEFSTSLLTAVSTSKAGDVRYLICIERTA